MLVGWVWRGQSGQRPEQAAQASSLALCIVPGLSSSKNEDHGVLGLCDPPWTSCAETPTREPSRWHKRGNLGMTIRFSRRHPQEWDDINSLLEGTPRVSPFPHARTEWGVSRLFSALLPADHNKSTSAFVHFVLLLLRHGLSYQKGIWALGWGLPASASRGAGIAGTHLQWAWLISVLLKPSPSQLLDHIPHQTRPRGTLALAVTHVNQANRQISKTCPIILISRKTFLVTKWNNIHWAISFKTDNGQNLGRWPDYYVCLLLTENWRWLSGY